MTSPARVSARIALTTVGAERDALIIARTLVDERLAACVNVLPVMTSVYRWKGILEQDSEHQLVMKTTADKLAELEARLRQLHPYELPEFLVLDVASGDTGYLTWLTESLSG